MSGNMAINPYGGAYKDPYFSTAHQFPNANAMTQYQYSPYLQIPGAIQGAQQSPQVVQQYPQAAATHQTAQPKKKGGTAALILGGIALTGAAILCHHKGNPDLKFFQRLWDGAKVCKNTAVNWCKKAVNRVKNVKTQRVSELTGELPQITKLTEEGKTVLNDNITLRNYTAYIKEKGARIKVKNGKLTKLTFLGEDCTKLYNTDSVIKAEIDGIISEIRNGQHLDTLKNIRFTQKADGVKQLFTAKNVFAKPKFMVGVKKA